MKDFIQGVAQRAQKMDRLEPGWNHYDLQHLLWVLSYYHGYFEDTFDALFSNKDWQGLNNYFYQLNRLDIFPTYVYYKDPPGGFAFYSILTAIAVRDCNSVEHLLPADRDLKQYIDGVKGGYPLHKVGEIFLAGLWHRDDTLLDYAIPKAEKFAAGKHPKWENAAIDYLLALQKHDTAAAGEHLENACKIMHTDFSYVEKKLFISAHGLYRLAERVLDADEFSRISMPEFKTFSREYAEWCRNSEPPQLYILFPEPADFLNDLLVTDWKKIPWVENYEKIYPMPAEWLTDQDI